MQRFRLAGALSALVALLAALPGPAYAQSPQTPAVWYRASAECPTGLEFLGKISDWQQRARLAQAGDHIDFVVTLLAGSSETVGRLERQTDRGTVAIRELRDATCTQVADALALSLGLALDPARAASEAVQQAPAPASEAAPPLPQPVAAEPARAPPAPAPPPVLVAASSLQTSARAPHPPRRPTFGLDAGVLTGLGTQTMLRGSAFVGFAHVTQQLSLRFAVLGALGTSPTPLGSVDRWLMAARGEVCPWNWGGARFGLSPCAAFELGATDVSLNGRSDHSLWAAPGLGLRAGLALASALRVELGVGALVPLLRAQVFDAAQPLYQDEMIAFHAALGVSFGQL